MPTERPSKVLLICGDEFLVVNRMLRVKKERLGGSSDQSRWVEFEVPQHKYQKKFMDESLPALDAEISFQEWNGSPKAVVLRGLVNTAKFRESVPDILSHVAPGNLLILMDVDDVVRGNWKSWESAVKACRECGEVVMLEPAISSLKLSESRQEAVKTVVESFSAMGKTVSKSAAESLAMMGPPERWYIYGEAAKISASVDSEVVSKDDIESMAFPVSSDYETWRFCQAFNSGRYDSVMSATNRMLSAGKPYELMYALCMKQLRWQLIGASLKTFGSLNEGSLSAFSPSAEAADKAAVAARAGRDMHPSCWNPDFDGGARNVESLRGRGASEIIAFVEDFLIGRCGGSEEAKIVSMRRYAAMFDAMDEARTAGSEHQDRIFDDAVKKVCWI